VKVAVARYARSSLKQTAAKWKDIGQAPDPELVAFRVEHYFRNLGTRTFNDDLSFCIN
jgi:hypothetical protein